MLGSFWADPLVTSPELVVGTGLLWLAGMAAIVLFGYRFSRVPLGPVCPVRGEPCELPYRRLLKTSGAGMLGCDSQGRIKLVNAWVEDLIGFTAAEIVGQHVTELMVPEDRPLVTHMLQRRRQGKFDIYEARVRTKDDGYLWVLITANPAMDDEGRGVGTLAMLTDITDQKRVEADLREHAQALEEANAMLKELHEKAAAASRVKSEFLANVTHEIRTPLTAILGYAETLLIEGDISKAPPGRVQAIQVIMRNGRYLLRIVNDILDLSKMEAGRLDVEQTSCSPLAVLADVLRLMQGKADAKGLALQTEFHGRIPNTMQSDPIRLRQILINLVGNALKFTESGSVRVVLACDENSDPPALSFEIIDTGIGISSEKLPHIFEPFCQADSSSSRRFGETGLGLSISQRLADRLGGEISAVSEEGLGSSFRLTLPVQPAGETVQWINDPAETLESMLDDVSAELPDAREIRLRGRILLAEDAVDNQRLIAHILRRAGLEVTTVANGREALQQALGTQWEQRAFDCILMDMQMPVMDGYDAVRQLRAAEYDRPIIALTAHAMAGEREKCLEAGCDEYAPKPIDRVSLLELIRNYLPEPGSTGTQESHPVPPRTA